MQPPARLGVVLAVAGLLLALPGCVGGGEVEGTLRLGYFPNLTHAQALYGLETGHYQQSLGPVHLRAVAFNAGPAAMQALVAGQVDATYVGPGPTLNTLAHTGSAIVRIVAGTASGGARFIVQPGLSLQSDEDFGGKQFASPGLGNTQDLSLKHYLLDRGHRTTAVGGDVQVINAANPTILTLFKKGDIDGAWVPEPWASRLESEAGGVELVDEADLWPGGQFVTTHLVTTKSYLARHPDVIRMLVEAHVNATVAIQSGQPEVLAAIHDGIESATGKRLDDGVLKAGFAHLNFTYDPLADTLYSFAAMSQDLGFLRNEIPPRGEVYRLETLNTVLQTRGLTEVAQP